MSGSSFAPAFRAVILGCGSSGGVPRLGGDDGAGDWGSCDPTEPRNRRSRCSLLVERTNATGDTTRALVDTAPDMREQLLRAKAGCINGVLLTHDHADQTHGLDDLRALAIKARRPIPVWLDDATAGDVVSRFRYCFEQAPGSWYPPILERRVIAPGGAAVHVEGPGGPLTAHAFLQHHGPVDSLGFRFGDLAYSSDVHELPEESFRALEGVRIWIVDALQMKPHGTHAHLEKTLGWIDRLSPERAILTNLHVTMDYRSLLAQLPRGVEPAHDGMTIEFRG